MSEIFNYEFEEFPDYHAVFSIQLCELIDGGFCDFDSPAWNFDFYDSQQRDRLWCKFANRFYYREIGITPPGRWKHEVLRKLNEIMPKYKPLYKAIDDGVEPLQVGSEYLKSRDIYSEFPQTQLSGTNQDYASSGSDRERELIRLGDWVDTVQKISSSYNDIDVMILNELETMFCAMFTVNVNSW